MTLPVVTGEFRVGTEPNLRFTPGGMAVCSMRAVASSRKKQDDGKWVDDKACWVNLVGFDRRAENMAESIEKGHLVTVMGKINVEEWEDREGVKRTTVNLVVDSIGPSLSWETATVKKADRESSQSEKSGSAQDPWSTSGQSSEDPPF